MSPASRSKSKDKRAGKEQQKASSKSSGPANTGSGIPASAYNPVSGTFHTIETSPVPSPPPLHTNGRFRNIDETDDHSGSSLGVGIEYDAVSNNDSCSGESEDHKEKTSNNPSVKHESIIPGADNDKREKIRQKNERKHQRQKERRAQELHEKCSGYLMSRKLEALAQQLVSMGFSLERSTMALILNEGRVEESVSWLFEGEADKQRGDQTLEGGGGNLKIDISEELARIADMEIRYKCSKQEVERAVVACEGDLEKASDSLRVQKQEQPQPPSAPPKPEENGDPPIGNSNGKLSVGTTGQSSQNSVRLQTKQNPSAILQQRRDEKDFNYTKAVPAGISVGIPSEPPRSKNFQPMKTLARPTQIVTPVEKRWPPGAGTNPSVSYSPLQVSPPPTKSEARYITAGNELKNLQPVREPVIMMQRPKQAPVAATTISSSPPSTGWYPGNIDLMNNGLLQQHIPTTRTIGTNDINANQLYHHHQHQQQQQQQQQLHYQNQNQHQHQHFVPGSSPVDLNSNRGNGLWSRMGNSPTLAASSLGLFSGLGSTGMSGSSSSGVDWSTGGSMLQLDYTNIDWSLDRNMPSVRPGGLWMGLSSYMKNNNSNKSHLYDSNSNSNTSAMGLGLGAGGGGGMRLAPSDENGSTQDNGGAETSSGAGSREWTSPFEGKDLFSIPREFVSSSL